MDYDMVENQISRRPSYKRPIIIICSVVVLAAVIICACIGIYSHHRNNTNISTPNSNGVITPTQLLGSICNSTRFPSTCISSISQFGSEANTTDPKKLFKLSLTAAMNELSKLRTFTSKLVKSTNPGDPDLKSAVDVCVQVLDDAFYNLNESISSDSVSVDDLRTWLSSTLTDQETCLDSLREMEPTQNHLDIIEEVKSAMQNSSEFAIISLGIVTNSFSFLLDYNSIRKLAQTETELTPRWVDRRILEEDYRPEPNVTVAQDGSGDFVTIAEALRKIKKNCTERFVIYVKEGKYEEEYVEIKKDMWNVMIYGDGIEKTIVSGHLNCKQNRTLKTFRTASFAVNGKRFIGKDIKFINTAGPQNEQAVAFRSDSDMSVCYRCAFYGFQDTLYLHQGRQFYRECDIVGTVDFIFGNAMAVLQNCKIMPKQPLINQKITITAQGKNESNQTTGFSIQNCKILPYDNNVTAQAYLGRPWKDFSTTVVIHSEIHSFLHPSGWSQWNSSLPPVTIYYGEFENTGDGSMIDHRVNWTGYKSSMTLDEAEKFSVNNFLKGQLWLPATFVPFDSNL